MSGTINKVTLLGHLGVDPEVHTAADGTKICTLRLATSKSWRDRQSGERRERTDWHRVSIFNEHLLAVAEKHLRRGSKVYVEGALQTRKWQGPSGDNRYSVEVVLSKYRGELIMLDGRRDAPSTPSDRDLPTSPRQAAHADLDDTIPF